jgi:hypothetical protein
MGPVAVRETCARPMLAGALRDPAVRSLRQGGWARTWSDVEDLAPDELREALAREAAEAATLDTTPCRSRPHADLT